MATHTTTFALFLLLVISTATIAHSHRLLDVHVGSYRSLSEKVVHDSGAGSCTYTNPYSHQDDCVQYTGSDWVASPDLAEAQCTKGPVPGASNTRFGAGTLCEGYSDEYFAGVCVLKGGEGAESRTVMISSPFNPFVSCPALKLACTNFAKGVFDGTGGRCKASMSR